MRPRLHLPQPPSVVECRVLQGPFSFNWSCYVAFVILVCCSFQISRPTRISASLQNSSVIQNQINRPSMKSSVALVLAIVAMAACPSTGTWCFKQQNNDLRGRHVRRLRPSAANTHQNGQFPSVSHVFTDAHMLHGVSCMHMRTLNPRRHSMQTRSFSPCNTQCSRATTRLGTSQPGMCCTCATVSYTLPHDHHQHHHNNNRLNQTTLFTLLEAAGLEDALNNTAYTVFAPSSAACTVVLFHVSHRYTGLTPQSHTPISPHS